MSENPWKLRMTRTVSGMGRAGQVIPCKIHPDGVIGERYWRRRQKDGVVEVFKDEAPKKDKTKKPQAKSDKE